MLGCSYIVNSSPVILTIQPQTTILSYGESEGYGESYGESEGYGKGPLGISFEGSEGSYGNRNSYPEAKEYGQKYQESKGSYGYRNPYGKAKGYCQKYEEGKRS